MDFKVNDKIISDSKFSKEQTGEVWKISELGVHVRFWDVKHNKYMYQIFRHERTHHMHSLIEELKLQ